MSQSKTLAKFISKAFANNSGFALWFLPGKNEINALVQENGSIQKIKHLSEIDTKKGFVFAPFHPDENYQTIFLQSDKFLKGFDEIGDFVKDFEGLPMIIPGNDQQNYIEISREEYLESCNSLIEKIRNGDADKVVLSRIIISKNRDKQPNPAEIFIRLKVSYPNTFCYLFYTSQTGLWMGASPENLVQQNGDMLKTMALAGTRRHHPAMYESKAWPAKEMQEQQFVTDFITNELKKLGLKNLQISSPYTSPAGAIEHICSDFVMKTDPAKKMLWKIIEALHPTPAVCGLPKAEAFKIISKIEKHNREYYTGFLGPVNFDGSSALFVNLRCMKILTDKFLLFIGGGITADSDAIAEWEETELKAGVLAHVIAND